MLLEEYIRLHYKPIFEQPLAVREAPGAAYSKFDLEVSLGKVCDDVVYEEKCENEDSEPLVPREEEFSESFRILHENEIPPFRFTVKSSFAESLIEWQRKKDLSSPQIYKACDINKASFSRLLNPKHHPSKNIVLALCIGLRLNKIEADEFLAKAGYAFSDADLRDVIVAYYIEMGQHDIYVINSALYHHGEDPLTGKN